MRHLLSLLLSITLPPQGMAVFHTKLTRLMVRTLSFFCLFFCFAAGSHAQIIIYDENGFYDVNPVSGTKSLICPNPDQITGADIAISPAGDVYGFRQDPNDTLIYLVKINLSTGESTNVFKLPGAGTGFVISEDNIAYIAAGINFFSVDMNTGQVSALSLLPYSSGCSGDLIFHEDQLFVSTTSTTLTNIDLNTLSSSISIPLLSQSIGIGAYNNCITGKKEYYLFGGDVLKVDISSRKVEKVPHWFYTSQGATSYHEFIPLPTPLLDTIITVPPNCNASDGMILITTTPGIDTTGFQVSLDSIHWQSNLVFDHLSVGIYTIFMKNDCGLASQTIILTSENAPDSVAYTAKSPICTSSTGRITLLSPAMDSLSFSLNGGPWQNNPVFDSIQKGHYYIYIKDNDGCINIQSLQLSETTAPTSWDLSIDHPGNELCQDETIAITLTVEPPSIVEWWIDSYYRIDSTQQTLEWIPSSLGTYYFQAIITNSWGCITELNQFSKTVLDCTIIPNAFSPNGDNANDSFGMVNYSPQNTNEMRIYNRWGQLAFQSDPSQLQWDGNTSDGQEAPPDVYIYQIQVHRNGQEILQKTGEVTLIR